MMEERDFGSLFHRGLSDWNLPNLNTLNGPFNVGQQNANTGSFPGFAFSGLPHFNTGEQPNPPHGWFYCLPRFRQAFAPAPNSLFGEKSLASPYENRDVVAPDPASGCAQKRFLVFDQSGDQTTLIFSSGIGIPVQCPNNFGPILNCANDLNEIELGTARDTIQHHDPILTDEFDGNHRADTGSEMHEDTEELNALLYSDDDEDYSEDDDEEASTGHSPSTMTTYGKQESAEEVASSAEPMKRRKLFDGGYAVPSLVDTASSVKSKGHFDHEGDAESSCAADVKNHVFDAESSCAADVKNHVFGEFGALSGNKRSIGDKIRETVGVLHSIIPRGKGKDEDGDKDKDVIVILDEAINYLISLKQRAKALSVDAL